MYRWNESDHWNLSFKDAHELEQARDSSRACSIKKSLRDRISASWEFVLVVGPQTDSLRKGSCQYCGYYETFDQFMKLFYGKSGRCDAGGDPDFRSFVEFECETAVRQGLRIVVLYNSDRVMREWCPSSVRFTGTHAAMCAGIRWDGSKVWNYPAVKKAIEG